MQYITKYKVKSNDWPGEVVLTFEAGELSHAENMRSVTPAIWDIYQKYLLPISEEHLSRYAESMAGIIIYEAVKIAPVNEKIAMFCAAFKIYEGVPYKATSREGNIFTKDIEVTPELLKIYFEGNYWPPQKSIANYVKNINNIRVDAHKAAGNYTRTASGNTGKTTTSYANRTSKSGESPAEMAESLFNRRHSNR